MNLADHYLARLAKAGIDTAFLVYGGAAAELIDAFPRQSAIRYVVCQHEQAAVFAAEGYSKAKGVPGLCIVTSGPGVGNIVTGLQNAFYDGVALIVLAGQVASGLLRPRGSRLRQRGFQETDAVAIARPVTKYAVQPEGPVHAQYCLENAIREATTGRPGPVLIDLCADHQRSTV